MSAWTAWMQKLCTLSWACTCSSSAWQIVPLNILYRNSVQLGGKANNVSYFLWDVGCILDSLLLATHLCHLQHSAGRINHRMVVRDGGLHEQWYGICNDCHVQGKRGGCSQSKNPWNITMSVTLLDYFLSSVLCYVQTHQIQRCMIITWGWCMCINAVNQQVAAPLACTTTVNAT